MTDIKIYRKNIVRFRGIFLFCVFLATALGMYIGFNLSTYESCIIIPQSPFEGGFLDGVIRVCLFDTLAFWLITVPWSPALTVAVSSAIFLFRGMVIGNGCRVFFANSSFAVCVVLLFSYIAVTLFLLIYDAYVNTNGKVSSPSRILSCFIATGGCAVVRILPMLLIK